MEWQPIETAPTDGVFLVYCADSPFEDEKIFIAEAEGGYSLTIHIDGQLIHGATHWMPLPEPPP